MDRLEHVPPEAISRTLPLLKEAPAVPDTTRGYLDLLGPVDREPPGPIQAAWESTAGAAVYDTAQRLTRKVFLSLRPPMSVLRVPDGGLTLDVGSGPGDITAELGRAVGPRGLALGVDISESMLERAVRDHGAPNVGFLRADATRLPFHDGTFAAVTCLAVLQLIPRPLDVVAELVRVLTPGGRLAIMVPSPRGRLTTRIGKLITDSPAGLVLLGAEELAESLHAAGAGTVHTRQAALVLHALAVKRGSRQLSVS
ncbi:class I SAM-dependent methyltransferase [Prauserella endophytica]|uniref:Methyltransferase domain-containing protein n=1 Tax=Prauserella endophytica TaxID=1592324 RepID=A0ABY2RZM5_9PSEU|nr:methyltransferase domain-containing protein [Prauserella endophytica]TKG66663.1 methyltransferase domain-containing protein [Prauserella endophytica]